MSGFAVSGVVFAGFCALIAARVFSTFRRDERAPEIWVALGFLASGASVIAAVGIQEGTLSLGAQRIAAAISASFSCIAGACVLRFVSLVFRTDAGPGRAVARAGIVLALALALVFALRAFRLDAAELRTIGGLNLVPALLLGSVLAWLAFEALRYWHQLRRQQALGLTTPLMVNRMLLYGIGSGLSAAVLLTQPLAAALGVDPFTHPGFQLASAILGSPIGVVYYLALVPPAAYQRWIDRSAATA